MESVIVTALRDILCASMSLDDGLSTIQQMSGDDAITAYEVARAIEEIILRRPGLASNKLMEISIKLASDKNTMLPDMLMLLDTRYVSAHSRVETEILPDRAAIPKLLDLLGNLSDAIESSLRLNLRPLLPFLADELLATLDAIHSRAHKASTALALREVHYLTWILTNAGLFEEAEALLNRLAVLAKEEKIHDLWFDASLDEAGALTELAMFNESREILQELRSLADKEKDPVRRAAVALQLSITETRDDSVSHEEARKSGDNAAALVQKILDSEGDGSGGLGLAQLIIGSNILANGWREAVPQALERLESGLEVFEQIEEPDTAQSLLLAKCLSDLGFAHGLMRDHESVTKSIEYLERAKTGLRSLKKHGYDSSVDVARCEQAIGWICLGTDSDELWSVGLKAFQNAVKARENLRNEGAVSELELVGSKMGLALSQMRLLERAESDDKDIIRETLVQYIPLFPTDTRAVAEAAIATYNIVWLATRHGGTLPDRLLRLLDDLDRMFSDARNHSDSIFFQGAFLVVPFVNASWQALYDRASRMAGSKSELSNASLVMAALAKSKMNVDAPSLESSVSVMQPVTEDLRSADPILAQYWTGQTSLARTVKAFYQQKDFLELAKGLYESAVNLGMVESVTPISGESAEFIRATSLSLSRVLMHFAIALEHRYGFEIDKKQYNDAPDDVVFDQIDFILAEDWLGLMKIAEAYLEMIETSETVRAEPYLNAVFSNVARALRTMDKVALVDRRVLSFLGDAMNKRYYLRS